MTPEGKVLRDVRAELARSWPEAVVWRLSPMLTRGLPDLIAFGQIGTEAVVLCVECKSPRGRLSAIQQSVRARVDSITTDSIRYVVARSADDVRSELEEIGNRQRESERGNDQQRQ